MTTGCFETSLLLFVNARGQGHYKLSNARSPVLIVKQMLGVCPGGEEMLAVGVDSHIISMYKLGDVDISSNLCG